MQAGRIKTLETDKGYGFITPDSATGRERGRERKVDIFFHRSAVADDGYDALVVGQKVRYERGSADPNQHRPRATLVTPIGVPAEATQPSDTVELSELPPW